VRLASIAELFEPVATRHLDERGIGPGWSCREVGAGGPGVAARMADLVTPTGRVVATDIDCSWSGDPGRRASRWSATTSPATRSRLGPSI